MTGRPLHRYRTCIQRGTRGIRSGRGVGHIGRPPRPQRMYPSASMLFDTRIRCTCRRRLFGGFAGCRVTRADVWAFRRKAEQCTEMPRRRAVRPRTSSVPNSRRRCGPCRHCITEQIVWGTITRSQHRIMIEMQYDACGGISLHGRMQARLTTRCMIAGVSGQQTALRGNDSSHRKKHPPTWPSAG